MLGFSLLILAIYLFQIKKFVSSLMLFILFTTNGFQIIPVSWLMFGLPIDKGLDLGILYLIVVAFLKFGYLKKIFKLFPFLKFAIILILFIFIDGIYSLIYLHYSIVNVIQVFRPYLFLLSFVLFFTIPIGALKQVFHILAILTIVQSILFLLQILLNVPILLSIRGNDLVTTTVLQGSGYVRYYNSPILLIPTLFYFLFVRKLRRPSIHMLCIAILVLTVIGPAHRSSILSVALVVSIYTLLKQSSSKRILYISIIGIMIFLGSLIPVISTRIDEAFLDLNSTFSSNLSLETIDTNQNTSTFRIGHFLERFTYIMGKPFGWLFGIGLISENAPYVSELPFVIGIQSEETGRAIQVDTGDLIWSPLVLTLGIVGTVLYVAFFIKLLLIFFKKIPMTNFAICGFLTVFYALIVSFTGTMMLDVNFVMITMLLMVLSLKAEF